MMARGPSLPAFAAGSYCLVTFVPSRDQRIVDRLVLTVGGELITASEVPLVFKIRVPSGQSRPAVLGITSGMPDVTSPSPIIEVFVLEVHATFPEIERNKLASYEDAIAKTTSEGDPHRARLCVKWAIRMADDKRQKHPRWEQLKERHQIWKDDWFAFDFGVADATPWSGTHHVVGKAEPIEDVRIQWVDNAVAVARRLGEEDGGRTPIGRPF